jgi:hypothetical protein
VNKNKAMICQYDEPSLIFNWLIALLILRLEDVYIGYIAVVRMGIFV